MRINKIHFKNFRGFSDFELELTNNRLAVFVGENASGKSSVFDGIRYLVLSLFNEKAPFKQDDVSFEKQYTELQTELTLLQGDLSFSTQVIGKQQKADSLLNYLQEITEENTSANIPIFSYYSSLKNFE